MERCARFRPGDPADPTEATRLALRALARRYQGLTEEMTEHNPVLDDLTARADPALRAAKGVGVDVAAILLVAAGDNLGRLSDEAAFAALCGVSPIHAYSRKARRHRLNRSGHRQANGALGRIAMVRATCDPAMKACVERRTAQGKSEREITRCLEHYIAREIIRLLIDPRAVPVGRDLRVRRSRRALPLHVVAEALGTSTTSICRLELGRNHDTKRALRYRECLEMPPLAA